MTINDKLDFYDDKYLDVRYGYESEYQKIDIIRPNGVKEKLPVVLYVHGGAWISGDKRSDGKYFTFDIPKYGYILATMNYRLAPDHIWKDQIADIKNALEYIKKNSDKYGIDAERIYIWGDSAGGHLAQLAALTYDDFKAVISFYGVSDLLCMDDDAKKYDMNWGTDTLSSMESPICMLMGGIVLGNEELIESAKKASPIYNVKKGAVPFLLQHGDADKEVYYMQSVRMGDELKKVSPESDIVLEIFKGADHSDPKIKSIENIERCIDFLDKYAYDSENPHR